MAELTPLFLELDETYHFADLGVPFRDIVTEGIIGSSGLSVQQRTGGANMSVDVTAGSAWVLGDTAPAQPCYRVRSDSTVNLPVTAAHATLPRIDLVVAEVLDAQFAGSENRWRLNVVAGTPAASPIAPAAPASALTLATISVAAAATSIISANITNVGLVRSTSALRALEYRSGVSGGAIASGAPATFPGLTFWTPAGATSTRITPPVPGVYMLHAHIRVDGPGSSGTPVVTLQLAKNGTVVAETFQSVAAGGSVVLAITDRLLMSSGDYIELLMGMSGAYTGAAPARTSAANQSWLSFTRLGAL